MKGLFTCGILDVMMERGLSFDGAVGVSAGATFGCNLKSKQVGRAVRYNKKYVNDSRYGSLLSILRSGDYYDVDFCYHTIPLKLDLWDAKAFEENPMDFYVVATDCETGKAVYHKCKKGLEDDLEWIHASAAVPIVCKPVYHRGRKLIDGGVGDPIPLRFFEHKGYDKIVVIQTKPFGYQDVPNNYLLNAMKVAFRDTPAIIKTQKNRYLYYNKTLEYIRKRELSGKVFVLRPQEDLRIGGSGKDEADIERVYQLGRQVAEENWDALMAYLNA